MWTLWIVCAESNSDCLRPSHLITHGYERRRPPRHLHEDGTRWVCDVCGKIYTRGDSLAHHRSIHRGDTVCPICRAVFTRKYTMRCHLLNIHGVK